MLGLIRTLLSEINARWSALAGKAAGPIGSIIDFVKNLGECGWGISGFIMVTMFIYVSALTLIFSSVFSIFAVGLMMTKVVPFILAALAASKTTGMIKRSAYGDA